MSFNFEELKKCWPSPIVSRGEVAKFSGGLLNPRTLANENSKGTGPRYSRMGRKVFYTVDDLVSWMAERAEDGK